MKENLNQSQVPNQVTGNRNFMNRRRFLRFGAASLATLVSSCVSIEVNIKTKNEEETSTPTIDNAIDPTVTATAAIKETTTPTNSATPNIGAKSTAVREGIETPTITRTATKTHTRTSIPATITAITEVAKPEYIAQVTATQEIINPTSLPVVENNNFAVNNNGKWILQDSDGNNLEVSFNAVGFTPYSDLKVSPLQEKDLGALPQDAGNFQAYLNEKREGFEPLAGYFYGNNDYNQYGDHKSSPQVPVFSWMVHTGLIVDMPGIGRVEGGNGRAVMVLIINRTERVYMFPDKSVEVRAGFQGAGKIWNGDENQVVEAEKRLVNHYRHRLGYGVAESGFVGQCDKGVNNCDLVTVVTVERVQWGNNPDGTPRDQFRLIRAETVSAK